MIGRLSQVFQFFAFELFVKFFSKIPQNSHQKVAISRYTMKPSLNVSRNFVLYAQIRAACKKWCKSYGSKKSSVPEKFSLVYSAVSLVNRSSRQDPTRGRKKSGDISPPPSCYRTPECGLRLICHTSSKGMPRHAHRLWASERYVTRRCNKDIHCKDVGDGWG